MEQAGLVSKRHLRRRSLFLRRGADALVIVTEWDAFRALDLGRMKQLMKAPVPLVDLRNIYRADEIAALVSAIERRETLRRDSRGLTGTAHLAASPDLFADTRACAGYRLRNSA